MVDLEMVQEGKCNVRKKKGGLCKLPAGFGTEHVGSGPCSRHGGTLPTVSLHHSTKLLQEAIRAQGGGMLEIPPDQALLEEVWRCAGRVAWIREKISHLEDREVLVESFGVESPAVWIRWEQQERVMLVNACKAAIAAGIAERQVRLAEEQGALVSKAFRLLLDDPELELSAKQKAKAPDAVVRALTLVSGGAVAS